MLKQHKLLDESTKRKQQVLAGQFKELKTLNANIDTNIKRLRELNETIQDSRACRSSNQQAKMYYVLSDGRGERLMLI
jgi:flagellar motility protein MotE (MotC chaperone)